jgi:hypothetical protein
MSKYNRFSHFDRESKETEYEIGEEHTFNNELIQSTHRGSLYCQTQKFEAEPEISDDSDTL